MKSIKTKAFLFAAMSGVAMSAAQAGPPTTSPPRKDTGSTIVPCPADGDLGDSEDMFVTVSPTSLWPPNHALIPVTLRLDDTGDADGVPITLTVDSITSSQGSASTGVGNTARGVEGTPVLVGVGLTAERLGADKAGNVYTIDVTCTETEPSETEVGHAKLTVVVPHDQGH